MPNKKIERFDIGRATAEWAIDKLIPFEHHDELSSTNDHAKKLNPESKRVVITSFQPKGRGRRSNTWESPPHGTALLSSWCFQVETPLQPILSPLVGLSVYKSLSQVFSDSDFSLKAPNDIYLGRNKLGGLLIEIVSTGRIQWLVIGIGINVFDNPELDSTTHLAAVDEPVTREKWAAFLDSLNSELTVAISQAKTEKLSENAREQLLDALNSCEQLQEKYESVLGDGSLKSASGLTSWLEL